MTLAKMQPRKHPGPKPARIPETDPLVNDLFRRMSTKEWTLLKPHLKIVSLAYGQILFEDKEPSDMAYFPMTAVISMLALMKNGDEVEYGPRCPTASRSSAVSARRRGCNRRPERYEQTHEKDCSSTAPAFDEVRAKHDQCARAVSGVQRASSDATTDGPLAPHDG